MNQAVQQEVHTAPAHVDRLMNKHFANRDGELFAGEVAVSEVVAAYGSPLFIYDRSVMNCQLAELRRTFTPRVDIFYSMKANPARQVLEFFVAEGCGIEIASAGELKQAITAGCPPEQILFAGPCKRDEELNEAVRLGIREIHVESIAEAVRLNHIAKSHDVVTRVALRINPAEAAQGGAMRMGGKPSPFGIDEEQLDHALETILSLPYLRVCGVHLFTGTQILDHTILITQYRKAIEIAERVARRLPHALESVDFGGGLGIPYFEREAELDLELFAPNFQQLLLDIDSNPLLANARLIIEPGRFLVGEAGLYVSRVIEIKESRGKTFAITDGGMHHHLAASGNLGQTIKRNYPIAVANRLDSPVEQKTEVVGPLCTPLDVLGRGVALPNLAEGDLMCVFQSGAYGRSSSPSGFLSHATPAEVMVGNGRHWLIRRAGDIEDYSRHQIPTAAAMTSR